jgi:microcystin-dependent protein
MSSPYLCEIRIFSFNFAPHGWAFCNGQLLPINQNQALFSLLGTTYGGNGQTTFALPNLQGRVPMYTGQGLVLGQAAGESSHTLSINEMPAHTHQVKASSTPPNTNTALNNTWASKTGFQPYATAPSELMAPSNITNTGGSQPHDNMSPYMVLNMCIALQGIFPSRN